MAEIGNVVHTKIPSGKLAADAEVTIGQPVHIHRALTQAISAATFNLVDTADISEGARFAQDVAEHNAQLTNSPNGAVGVPGVHPVINGIAELRHTEQKLAQKR